MFTLPDPIYEGESVKLESSRLTDSDNDTLNFIWKIDGSSYTSNIITFTPGKHTIILIANDGHGLSNSIDSIQKDIFVLSKPDLKSIDFPKDCLINATVTISEITSFTSVGFLINQILEKMWLAQTTGEQTITIGWALKGEILAKENYVTTVWPLLKFATTPEPITITWNPSNPSIVLTAPDVNRPESRKVQYEWRKGQTLIGHGKVIEARLNAGRNIFTIRAIDQDIFGMRQAEVEIVVICE
jgi:hypothetical protein